jgi:hypothetical protein
MIDEFCICKFDDVLVMKGTLNQALLSKICRTTVCISRLSTDDPFRRKTYCLNIDFCSVPNLRQARAPEAAFYVL